MHVHDGKTESVLLCRSDDVHTLWIFTLRTPLPITRPVGKQISDLLLLLGIGRWPHYVNEPN